MVLEADEAAWACANTQDKNNEHHPHHLLLVGALLGLRVCALARVMMRGDAGDVDGAAFRKRRGE